MTDLRHAPGDRIGPWILEALLGQGGFSEVWRARLDLDLAPRTSRLRAGPQPVVAALKLLVNAEHVAGLRSELGALATVSGTGIVRTLDASFEHDPPYLALELMPGGDLRSRLRRRSLGPGALLQLLEAILSVLVRVHAEGIVHGDLKPENVLFDAQGRVHLADFGLSRRVSQRTATLSVSLSLADARLAGTLDYMAPELREGAKPTRASDVYALGVILHELLLGERPQGLSARASERIPALPPAVDRLLEATLAPDPRDRLADAAAVLKSLRAGLWNDAAAIRARSRGLGERQSLTEGWPLLWAGGVITAAFMAHSEPTWRPTNAQLGVAVLAAGLPLTAFGGLIRAGQRFAAERRTGQLRLETLNAWRGKREPPPDSPPSPSSPAAGGLTFLTPDVRGWWIGAVVAVVVALLALALLSKR